MTDHPDNPQPAQRRSEREVILDAHAEMTRAELADPAASTPFAQVCEAQCQYAHVVGQMASGCVQSGCLWLAHHPDDPRAQDGNEPSGARGRKACSVEAPNE